VIRDIRILAGSLAAALLLTGCRGGAPAGPHGSLSVNGSSAPAVPDPLAPIEPARTAADRIVNRAKEEARRGVVYDASYRRIAYPGGDVPADRGACTDVIVRSLRAAGTDLQQRIHEDILADPDPYHLRGADPNIDHRRCTCHMPFLRRHAKSLTTRADADGLAAWQAGDLVYWKLPNGLDHCGVVSNVRNEAGVPLVIHNIGITRQEDCLTRWKIVAHFRVR